MENLGVKWRDWCDSHQYDASKLYDKVELLMRQARNAEAHTELSLKISNVHELTELGLWTLQDIGS